MRFGNEFAVVGNEFYIYPSIVGSGLTNHHSLNMVLKFYEIRNKGAHSQNRSNPDK